MNQLKKHILFFDFLENHYVSNDEVSKQHLSVIKKSNFVKATDKLLDRIEEKNVDSIEKPASEKSVFVKTEKPLIDLPSQREKVMFRTSQSKMLEVVAKMLSELKVKTEGTSRSAACTISKNEKEIVSDEHTDSDIVSSISAKKIFDNDLPEIKRFVGNPKPMSL